MPSLGFDWRLFSASFRSLRWTWLIASPIPLASSYYVRAWRWKVFRLPLKHRTSTRNLLICTLIGFAAITLFGRPGGTVRPYFIALKGGVSISSQRAIWLVDRVFDLVMALVLFGFALT